MTNKDAIDRLNGMQSRCENGYDAEAIYLAIKSLEDRPTGKWIKGREISRTMFGDEVLHIDYENFTCSICGLVLDNLLYHCDGSPLYKHCPNCGAKMKEAEND